MDNDGRSSEGKPRTIKVLMYHRIVEEKAISDAHWSCVYVEDFRKQLELLDRWGFTAITFEDYRLFLSGELNLPRKPVVLTFDDGYLDTYTTAFPLLQEYGVKAVVYVIGNPEIKTNSWDLHVMPESPLMERHHIVEMHEAGIEIGSHTLSHANLNRVTEEQAWEEISRSRILLEILLNAPVSTFAYPYGILNPKAKTMIVDAGYSLACSVSTGPAAFSEDPMEIRRITIFNRGGTAAFALRMLTPYQYYGWTRWKAGNTIYGSGRTGRVRSEGQREREEDVYRYITRGGK